MAKAIIQSDADGGIEVVVPAWENMVVTRISAYSITQFPAFIKAGDEEPDYDVLTDEIAEQLVEQLGDPAVGLSGFLRQAVYQTVAPGPVFTKHVEFDV